MAGVWKYRDVYKIKSEKIFISFLTGPSHAQKNKVSHDNKIILKMFILLQAMLSYKWSTPDTRERHVTSHKFNSMWPREWCHVSWILGIAGPNNIACSQLTHWSQHKMDAIFPNNIFKWIFLNENAWILIRISVRFVPKGEINNIPALIQIRAWFSPCDKPLSEPMMVSLLMHTCVTRPQWVNIKQLSQPI